MPDERMRALAAAHVDERFHKQQQNLVQTHRHAERFWLDHGKVRLREMAQRRNDAEWNHAQRLRSIETKRDHIADRLHRQHNSIGGRFEALTRKGRARQADRLEQLDDRMRQLQGNAIRRHNVSLERHDQAMQRERIFVARNVKLMRQDNLDQRHQHRLNYQNNRERLIDDRVRAMVRVQAHSQKQQLALKQNWTHAQQRQDIRKVRKPESLVAEFKAAQQRRTLRDSFQQSQGQSLRLRRI